MSENRIGLGLGLGAAALALGLGVAAGHTLGRYTAPSKAAVAAAPQPSAAVAAAPQPSAAKTAAPQPSDAAPADGLKRYMVPVSDSQPSLGAKDALVTIVQWCDLPDAACAAFEPKVRELLDKNPQTLKLVFRHFGRPDRTGSPIAHYLARAAHQQAGKFWEARSLLLAHSGEMNMEVAERYAEQLGLSWKDVRTAIDDKTYVTPVTADRVFASMFDVEESPAFFVNGRPLGKLGTPAQFGELVDDELKRAGGLVASGVDRANVYAVLTREGAWNKPKVQ